MSVLDTLLAGRRLFIVWPRVAKLNMVFYAGYLVRVLEFANRAVPIAIAFLGVWYFMLYHYHPETSELIAWPAALACMLFLLFLPLLGYWKLGVFASKPLSEAHQKWYLLVCEKSGLEPVAKPDYMVLAKTVGKALAQENTDRSFLDEL